MTADPAVEESMQASINKLANEVVNQACFQESVNGQPAVTVAGEILRQTKKRVANWLNIKEEQLDES